MVSKVGQIIRLNLQDIPSQGRATQGVYLMRMDKGDFLASVSLIIHQIEEPVSPAAEVAGDKKAAAKPAKEKEKESGKKQMSLL